MTVKLAGAFPAKDHSDWQTLVEASERTPSVTQLGGTTDNGDRIEALYTHSPPHLQDERPGLAPFTRGDTNIPTPWKIRQRISDSDLDTANRILLRELQKGTQELTLRLDAATRAGMDPDGPEAEHIAGQDGLPIASVDDLDLLLAGVQDDRVPIILEGGVATLPQAALLIGLWKRRYRDGKHIHGSLGAAPLSAWAETGALPGGPDEALRDVARLAQWCAEELPLVRVARANEHPFHNAGASDAEGLGLMLAESLATLRAFARSGHNLVVGCGQLELSVALSSDIFEGITKLRAVRKVWTRILEVLNLPLDGPRPTLVAGLGRRAYTQFDPWVNILRGTAATFAAAVGSASAITLEPFDCLWGPSDELSRRLARNTHIILQQEAHLSQVIDPAGGSWYLEHRTEQLAASIWKVLQDIETEGGLANALQKGVVHKRLETQRNARQTAVAERSQPITGVSSFPNPSETMSIRALSASPEEVQAAARSRLNLSRTRTNNREPPTEESRVTDAITWALEGKSLGQIQTSWVSYLPPAVYIDPLPSLRLAEPLENLRNIVRRNTPPAIYLATIGPIARHTARATFAQNLVGVGGFQVTSSPITTDPEVVAKAFRTSGARVAIICGAQDDYTEYAASFIRALRDEGAHKIYLAGHPAALDADLKAASLDGHFALGLNVELFLKTLLEDHGLPVCLDEDRGHLL